MDQRSTMVSTGLPLRPALPSPRELPLVCTGDARDGDRRRWHSDGGHTREPGQRHVDVCLGEGGWRGAAPAVDGHTDAGIQAVVFVNLGLDHITWPAWSCQPAQEISGIRHRVAMNPLQARPSGFTNLLPVRRNAFLILLRGYGCA